MPKGLIVSSVLVTSSVAAMAFGGLHPLREAAAPSGAVRIATEAAPSAAAVAATPRSARTTLTSPTLAMTGDPKEVLHDSAVTLCGTKKIHIDSPVRIFKDQYSTVHMTVSDPGALGWQWTGTSAAFRSTPSGAALDCTSVMNGNSGNTDPAMFDQKGWIQAFHFDGTTAHAYSHQDYFGTRTSEPGCHDAGTTDGLPYCWYASIGHWRGTPSASGAITFAKSATAPGHGAIYPHVQYPGHSGTPLAGWIGYGTPSNIIRGRTSTGALDGYSYMFVYTNSGTLGQAKGVCLFRSADPADGTSWRAWNGSTSAPAFTQAMGNPYTTTNSACAVASPTRLTTGVRGVLWHKPSRHYVAVLTSANAVRYTTSPDLLTWSPLQTLHTIASSQAQYPVLVDFDGGDWGDVNFDRLYSNDNAYIVVRESVVSGHTRIVRHKFEVTNYAADVPSSSNPG